MTGNAGKLACFVQRHVKRNLDGKRGGHFNWMFEADLAMIVFVALAAYWGYIFMKRQLY